METIKSKTSAAALLLLLTMAFACAILPVANAQITRKTYAFCGVTPNPVGVGQAVLIHLGISQQTATTYDSWKGLTVTVTKPDGTTETLGPFKTDSTGGTGYNYIPTMTGVYKFQTHFPQQVYAGFGQNITWLASDSPVTELVVQSEQIPYFPGFPLPNEYWTRPINAQFHEWAPIAGNWLRPAGSYTMPPIPKYHPYNEDAPETAHILWTKQYAQGGLTGGDLGNVQYEMGDAYVGKFLGSVIIDGVVYYNQFQSTGGTAVEQPVVAVDLKTGEELWRRNWNNTRLAFGQVFFWDSFNYHGAFAYLWTETGTTWDCYDAFTGRWLYRLTNVPSGYNLYGPKGEIYRYTVNLQQGWMTLWNSSRAINPQRSGGVSDGSWTPIGSTFNATQGIEWNKTIPLGLPGSVAHYAFNDCIFGSTSYAFPAATGPTLTSWAISTKIGDEGRLIFKKEWTVPAEYTDGNWAWTDVSFEDRVFIISCKESLRYYGFSLDTGEFLWETEPEHYLAFYDKWYGPAYGYGKFYTGRMTGIVTCYDIKTGKKLWTYNVSDKYAEILWSMNFPIEFHFLADGKLYLSYGEHSPINPTGRGAPMVCLDAITGEKIWEISWFNNWWGGHVIIGDSIMVGMNGYDNRLYAFGKGPSATTVSASPKISVHGSKVLVEGMVTDISPGTKEYALTARFPNGVPVVADESMTEWMEYVYMQYPRPTDVKGVEVTVTVLDPNNNCYDVATATTDSNGFFSCTFEPPVPGKYTIIATFKGSKAYYGSSAETAVFVEDAPPASPESTPETASMADLYFLPVSIAMIIAIIIVLVLLILVLKKK
ncbi:MAG: PQQ-binding-like beta-propeller repeat protein [Candidatus Bathyarchaeia archaeon]